MIKQPETRPISQEQLVAEVKGIYAGLVMVESKCIEADNTQARQETQAGSERPAGLSSDQWQALIALHRTLLHEHHDFFLASQHPSASPSLGRLAAKYSMPARMWRHGIHSFLELLRHRLPANLDHMLSFIYMAYSMMALLHETVPDFKDTWIECLGDLGRYRMAIEDDDVRDREVWTAVSRDWYSCASDKAPTTGRLYHHLAILARPNALQQVYYYARSLCVDIPFSSAREVILDLFEPIMGAREQQHPKLSLMELNFVKTHGIIFGGQHRERGLDAAWRDFLAYFIRRSDHWRQEPDFGNHIAALIIALGDDRRSSSSVENGDPSPGHWLNQTVDRRETPPHPLRRPLPADHSLKGSLFDVVDPNSRHGWNRTVDEHEPHRRRPAESRRPLPEDFALRGFERLSYFSPNSIEGDSYEMPIMLETRQDRDSPPIGIAPPLEPTPRTSPWTSAQNTRTSVLQKTGGRFRLLLRTCFLLSISATLVAANPPIPHRMPKVLTLSTSGMLSFSSSMVALQINNNNNTPASDPLASPYSKVALRIASSGCLVAFFSAYTLWFLRGAHRTKKAARFVYGLGLGGAALWILWRLTSTTSSAPPSNAAAAEGEGQQQQRGDPFQGLDLATIFGLGAVLVGILNAESSLFSAAFAQSQSQGQDQAGGGDEEDRAAAVVQVPGHGAADADAPHNGARRGGWFGLILANVLNNVLSASGAPL